MSKRLELAKNLLKEDGLIFISIGDDEQANLELLCNKIFGESNKIENYIWESTFRPDNSSLILRRNTEFVLCYARNYSKIAYFKGIKSNTEGMPSLTKAKEKIKTIVFPKNTVRTLLPNGIYHKGVKDNGRNLKWELLDDVEVKDGVIISTLKLKGHSYWATESKIIQELEDGTEIWIKSETFVPYYKKTKEAVNRPTKLLDREIVNDYVYSNSELKRILGETKINNPKPTTLISFLCDFIDRKSSIILDFFAGSGTTLHATMKLNAEDGGNRQCILVQQKEGDKNICESVTYERNKRVINGYENAKGEQIPGLGNSLKYYKTAFVGKHPAKSASDDDKIQLSLRAGCLLALAENTLEEIETTNCFQIFSDGNRHYTGVYFTGKAADIPTFAQKLETLRDENRRNKISAYFFCWGDSEQFEDEFTSLERISLKPIPKPILDIYQSINN